MQFPSQTSGYSQRNTTRLMNWFDIEPDWSQRGMHNDQDMTSQILSHLWSDLKWFRQSLHWFLWKGWKCNKWMLKVLTSMESSLSECICANQRDMETGHKECVISSRPFMAQDKLAANGTRFSMQNSNPLGSHHCNQTPVPTSEDMATISKLSQHGSMTYCYSQHPTNSWHT